VDELGIKFKLSVPIEIKFGSPPNEGLLEENTLKQVLRVVDEGVELNELHVGKEAASKVELHHFPRPRVTPHRPKSLNIPTHIRAPRRGSDGT
ncbi:MAG: hypothetical protein NZ480_03435, partial [Bdellovibrionaceae bacterium]|nr:hypothetical protein [Pseudobdellovibrionaceae bacterium]